MNAATARKATDDWMKKATKDNIQWNKEREKREASVSAALWKTRAPVLLAKIEGYIKEASGNGGRGTFAPSVINPNGDPIIWLEKTDGPIHQRLMAHYRGQGFAVTEYSPMALKITW